MLGDWRCLALRDSRCKLAQLQGIVYQEKLAFLSFLVGLDTGWKQLATDLGVFRGLMSASWMHACVCTCIYVLCVCVCHPKGTFYLVTRDLKGILQRYATRPAEAMLNPCQQVLEVRETPGGGCLLVMTLYAATITAPPEVQVSAVDMSTMMVSDVRISIPLDNASYNHIKSDPKSCSFEVTPVLEGVLLLSHTHTPPPAHTSVAVHIIYTPSPKT